MSALEPGGAGETTAADSVGSAYAALRADILDGVLEPGAVLSQVQLARELGISRTPLREALRRLMAEQLVTGDFNRRMRVSELNLEDLDQIYAMRLALEPLGVAATVPRLDQAERSELAAHVAQMSESIEVLDLEQFRREHRAFHLGLTAGSGSRMRSTLADLWDHSERYRLAYLHHDYGVPGSASAERLRISQDEHHAILDAAIAGDVAACTSVLDAHLRRTVSAVFRESALVPRPRLVPLISGDEDA